MTDKTSNEHFFWAAQEQIGALPAGFKSLFCGIVRPRKHMAVPDGEATGFAYLFGTYGLFCILPIMLLHAGLVIYHQSNPGAMDFNDINPYTFLFAAPLQFLVAIAHSWLIGWCLYAALSMTGFAKPEDKQKIRALGWVIGAALYTVFMLWFGLGMGFYTAFSNVLEMELLDNVMLGSMWVAVLLTIRAYFLAIAGTMSLPFWKAIGPGILGFIGLVIAWLPLGFILQVVIITIVLSQAN